MFELLGILFVGLIMIFITLWMGAVSLMCLCLGNSSRSEDFGILIGWIGTIGLWVWFMGGFTVNVTVN